MSTYLCSECGGAGVGGVPSRRFIPGCDIQLYVCQWCSDHNKDLEPRDKE